MHGYSITKELAEQRCKRLQDMNRYGHGTIQTMRSLTLKEYFFVYGLYKDWDKAKELGFVGSSTVMPYKIVPRPHANKELEVGLIETVDGLIALHYEDHTLIDPRAKYGWA